MGGVTPAAIPAPISPFLGGFDPGGAVAPGCGCSMTGFCSADHSVSPPRLTIPRDYNAAHDLLESNLAAGRGDKVAIVDDQGRTTYAELAQRVNRCGNALKALGVGPEQRVLLCLLDSVAFPSAFLGAIKIGAVPVADQYAADRRATTPSCCATAARVSRSCRRRSIEKFEVALADQPWLERIIIADGPSVDGLATLDELMAKASDRLAPAATTADDPAFWLYSSGSTGTPKGTVHVHGEPGADRRALCPAGAGHPARATSCSPRRSCSSPMAWATR